MAEFAIAIVALLLFFFGIFLGYRIGEELGARCVTTREYGKANIETLVIGVIVSGAIWATGWLLLAGLAVGGMAGVLVGLKMSFGESVGPWKVHDRFFRVNKDQVKRSKSKTAEAARRARRDGTPMPEFISVADKGPAAHHEDAALKRDDKSHD